MNKFTKILYQVRLLNILKVKVIENSIIIDLRKPVPSGLLEHKVFFKLKIINSNSMLLLRNSILGSFSERHY